MEKLPLASLMKVMKEIVSEDTSIAIANEKQFIHYQPSKRVNLNIRPGDILDEETVTFKALANQKKVTEYKDEHLFGIPYFGISVPILHEGKSQGGITIILPREDRLFPTSLLTIRIEDRWIPVHLDNVICLEAVNRKTKVSTLEHFGRHRLNLRELEYMLPSDTFVRCHRSYIVNINHIKEIHPDSHSTFMLIMQNGLRVPVSQTYASDFRSLLHF